MHTEGYKLRITLREKFLRRKKRTCKKEKHMIRVEFYRHHWPLLCRNHFSMVMIREAKLTSERWGCVATAELLNICEAGWIPRSAHPLEKRKKITILRQ